MFDQKDFAILRELQLDSRASVVRIAKRTHLPPTTVHNRIRKLQRESVIKRYTIELDNRKLGKDIAAYVLIAVDYRLLKEKSVSQYELAEKIRKHGCVEEVSMVTGASDILVKLRSKSMDELNNFITKELRRIDGVEKTQTMMVLCEL